MKTKRYAIDRNQRKLFIGSSVKYKNDIFLVKEIDYLSWTTNQYLTLVSVKNKNKKLEFIQPRDVNLVRYNEK